MKPLQPAYDTGTSRPPKKHGKWKVVGLISLALVVFFIGAATTLLLLDSTKPVSRQSNTATKSTKGSGGSSASTATTPDTTITNTWKSSVNATKLPLGDSHVSTSPRVGYVYSCSLSFNGRGADHAGNWLDSSAGTWNSTDKIAVQGAVQWSSASYNAGIQGAARTLTTNDLPVGDTTGIFPIRQNDPAYQYDRNPNSIVTQSLTYDVPYDPTAASAPSCTHLGAIGVMTNGVLLFNALDADGRDAVAHEVQDSCDGHPDGQEMYHYHDVSSCILAGAKGPSTLVGYALDGYGIYVERDANGNLPTNADLDECHGRTSMVMWNGKLTDIYHYSATLEYPYTIGCYRGTPVH